MRVIPCPIPGYDQTDDDGNPVYFVGLPDVWLGKHEERRSAAYTGAIEGGVTLAMFCAFGASMAILDDWNLPDLPKNPEAWDLANYPVAIMAWVNAVTHEDIMDCFNVKKKYYRQSANGTNHRAVRA